MIPGNEASEPALIFIKGALLSTIQDQRMGLLEAANFAKSVMKLDPVLVDAAVDALEEKAKSHKTITKAVVSPATSSSPAWYLGPSSTGHWQRYFKVLEDNGSPGLEDLDVETTRITAMLADPHVQGQRRKGLVMGNVQSGKTRNFAGVIAKATDAGYRFVIVLSGMHNNLREQTQTRLDSQLFDGPGWYPLTSAENDFEHPLKPAELFLKQSALCVVVKKNTNRLGKLLGMLKSLGTPIMRKTPVLIIDDEADQATPNSMEEKQQVSAINQHLRSLWGTVVTGTYLAYTATPFANVLMDPDNESDLFPSDFITSIEPGRGYFGAERVFGISETVPDNGSAPDGLDMVRTIPPEDAKILKPPSNAEARMEFDPEPPPSMLDALDWFIVATGIRRARGQDDHSSMLVHTTHYAVPHFAMQEQLELEVARALSDLKKGDVGRFEAAWDREATQVARAATVPLPQWGDVLDRLPEVLSSIKVIVDNGSSTDRLNYELPGQIVIAIGGGTLSRGLTLEGLTVSYFTRTSNTYDTLLQMGRWFGYRNGYEDLPRVWVTEGLDTEYAFLARVEKDLREEIASVQASEFTPQQVGVKIRTHPGRLAVTSANRMYAAKVVQLGLSETSGQTFLLDGDPKAASMNIRAVERLITGSSLAPIPWQKSRHWARDVTGDQVRQFLRTFRVHSSQEWLSAENREIASRWIDKWAAGPVWNVVLVSNSATDPELGTIEVGGLTLNCLNRSPMSDSSAERVNMKAVMSQGDRIADIAPSSYVAMGVVSDADRRRVRRLCGDGRGLILVYPLSANAMPKTNDSIRMAMPVDHHQLAFAIIYPSVNDTDGEHGSFISVKRTWEVPDTVEGDEESPGDEDE